MMNKLWYAALVMFLSACGDGINITQKAMLEIHDLCEKKGLITKYVHIEIYEANRTASITSKCSENTTITREYQKENGVITNEI